MKIFRKLKSPLDFPDALLLGGAGATVFGIYQFSHPAALVCGGIMAMYTALRMGSQ